MVSKKYKNQKEDFDIEKESSVFNQEINQDFNEDDVENSFYENAIDNLSKEIESEEYERTEEINEDDDYNSYREFNEKELNKSRFMSPSSMIRFFKSETDNLEFARQTVTFIDERDSSIYKGIVLKQMKDTNSFVFLIEHRKKDGTIEKKMKKFSVNDISVFI